MGCCRLLGRAARAGHLLPCWAGLPARCWRLRRALLGRAHSPALAAAAAAPAPALATALGRARCWAAPLRWAARLLPLLAAPLALARPRPRAAALALPLLRPLGRCCAPARWAAAAPALGRARCCAAAEPSRGPRGLFRLFLRIELLS